jgi:hypothetical protein
VTCPHRNIVHCPLYVAAHGRHSALGCGDFDGEMNAATGLPGRCAVDRGADYEAMIAALDEAAPGLVWECRAREGVEEARRRRGAA